MTPSTETPIGPHTVPVSHEKSSAHAELFLCDAVLRPSAARPCTALSCKKPVIARALCVRGNPQPLRGRLPYAPYGGEQPRADRVVRPYKPFRRGRRPRRPAFTSCHVIRRAGCPHPAARTMGNSVAVFRRFLTKRLVKGRALCYTLLEKQKCGSSRVRQHPRACAGVYTTYTTAKWPHRMEYYTPYQPFL